MKSIIGSGKELVMKLTGQFIAVQNSDAWRHRSVELQGGDVVVVELGRLEEDGDLVLLEFDGTQNLYQYLCGDGTPRFSAISVGQHEISHSLFAERKANIRGVVVELRHYYPRHKDAT